MTWLFSFSFCVMEVFLPICSTHTFWGFSPNFCDFLSCKWALSSW